MKQMQQLLFPQSPVSKPAPVLRRRVLRAAPLLRRVPLWLAVHLPDLPLETLLHGQAASKPRAIIDPDRGVARICAMDARAAEDGIKPGMTLAAAWALAPELDVHERDVVRERNTLHRLAAWAGRFTPTTCIDGQSLLLEVRSSLQLFGGATALRNIVHEGISQLGFNATIAMAPTPRAALWLAQAGHEIHVDQPESLTGVLGKLPLSAMGFEENLLERFQGIGARCLRDLLRLPRDGLARRYSARAVRELDQALGRTPDVRRPLPPPKKFSARVELLYEVSDSARLLHPVQQLLHELDEYLQATQQGVSRLQLQLGHRDGTSTSVVTGFAEATRDAARIRDLVEQKFETAELPAPVLEIVLQAEELAALAGRDRALFVEQRDDESWPQLVERLCTRLGPEAVRGIEQQADHRPERAWRYVMSGAAHDSPGLAGRPQWLLEAPQALRVQKGNPVSDGPLEITAGPERIETGWWDGADIVRDYYVARDVHGRRLWICREARTGRWWLQGIYG